MGKMKLIDAFSFGSLVIDGKKLKDEDFKEKGRSYYGKQN